MSLVDACSDALLRLYYPVRDVAGRLPDEGVCIVVANHPNGLLDPLMVRLLLGRRAGFLAKSTFWSNPVGRWVMESSGALPVYRAHEGDTAQNEATFARCRGLLAGGVWLALFPEGKSHSEATLQPLKTGAARIALSTLAEHPGLRLRILPVGLYYEDKAVFRSRAAGTVGQPVEVADLMALYAEDPRAAVVALTGRVDAALGAVVLQGETAALRDALYAVAGWMAEAGEDAVAAREARARELARRWAEGTDDERSRAIAAFQTFAARMDALGVQDPWSVLAPDVRGTVARTAGALALAPLALVGAVFAWVPYRLVRPVARRLAGGHDDVVGTAKALVGALVLGLTYAAEAVAAAAWQGPWIGVGVAVVAPLSGYVALRFDERMTLRWQALRGAWFARDAAVREAVARERAALSAVIRR